MMMRATPIGFLLAAALTLTAAPSPAEARKRPIWALQRTIAAGNAPDHSILAHGTRLCFSADRAVKLTCVDAATGKSRFTRAGGPAADPPWRAKGLFLDRGQLVQAYASRRRLLVRRVDPSSGRLVRESSLDFTRGRFAEVLSVTVRGERALISYRRRMRNGYVTAVDLKTRRIVHESSVPGLVPRVTRGPGDVTLYVHRLRQDVSLQSFDIKTGRRRWATDLVGTRYLRGFTRRGNRIYVLDSKSRFIALDARTGRIVSRRQLDRQSPVGYVRPFFGGGMIFVLGKRLHAIDPRLKTRRTRRFGKAWFSGRGLVHGGHLFLHERGTLHILNARTLRPVTRLTNRDPWSFQGPILPLGDRVVAINRYRYNRRAGTELRIYGRSRSGTLDLAGLAAGVIAYRDGRPLGPHRATLPAGRHTIDLLKPGHYPVRTVVRIPSGGTVRLPRSGTGLRPVPSPTVTIMAERRLPPGTDLARLWSTPAKIYRLGKRFHFTHHIGHRSRLYAARSRAGLIAYDLSQGRIAWDHSPSALARLLFGRGAMPRRAKVYPVAVAPAEGVVVIITESVVFNRLAAFDLKTGRLRWTSVVQDALPHMSAKMGSFTTIPYRVRHGLLWSKADSHVYGIDLRNGRRVFRFPVPRGRTLWDTLRFAGDRLFFLTVHGQSSHLRAVHLYSQKVLWSRRFPRRATLAISSDRSRLFILQRGLARALSVRNGRTLATRRLRGKLGDLSPVLDKDNIYLTGNFVSRFYALRQRDLRLLWTYRPRGRESDPGPVFVAGRYLLAAADRGLRILLDKRTGRPIKAGPRTRLGFVRTRQLWRFGRSLCFRSYPGVACLR